MTGKFLALLSAAVMLSMAVGQSWGNSVSSGIYEPFNGGNGGADPLISFDFSSLNNDLTIVGSVDLDATGTYVTSGSIYVTSPDLTNAFFSLIQHGDTDLSPRGQFYYDNQLSSSEPRLDLNGLLFGTTDKEINIYYDSGSYHYYEGDASGYPVYQQITFTLTPEGNATAVPLPASVGVGFSMLGGFGALFGMRKRLSRRPRIA